MGLVETIHDIGQNLILCSTWAASFIMFDGNGF